MSWGTELWDQTDSIASHLQKGIDSCEKFSHFLKEKCSLENEYASKLKRLVKSHQPKRKEEDCEFTCTKAFQDLISEINDIAGQHECIAENLTSRTVKNLQLLIQQLKNDRRKHLQDNAKQASNMQNQWVQLDKVKGKYEKAFRDLERARDQFLKADADINLSRADVEKARNTMQQKQSFCDSVKGEYASELQKTNSYQREHFDRLMPEIIRRLQELEESRINSMMSFYKECVETERKVMPIISKCIDGMEKASGLVSSSTDTKVVIDKYKSGFLPPDDIPFEELSLENDSPGKVSPAVSVHSLTRGDAGKSKPAPAPAKPKKKTSKILGLFGSSKNDEVKEDFSHLPPTQQKKKLLEQINSLKTSIAKETAERDGMLKLQGVYQNNPALGDAQLLGKQLDDSAHKLKHLIAEMQKFQVYLAEVDGTAPQQESWSTNQSVSQIQTNSENHVQLIQALTSEDQDDQGLQLDLESQSLDLDLDFKMISKAKDGFSDASDGSFDGPEENLNTVSEAGLGLCTALYPFTAENEQSLSMAEGEQFTILEQDQGDGWIRVKNSSGAEGFVPCSYVECQ